MKCNSYTYCGSNNILNNHEQRQKYLHYVLYITLFLINVDQAESDLLPINIFSQGVLKEVSLQKLYSFSATNSCSHKFHINKKITFSSGILCN